MAGAKGWDLVNEELKALEFEVDVEATKASLLAQEDSDHDGQITIDDQGVRVFNLYATGKSDTKIEGTYQLANLLQELTLVSRAGRKTAIIKGSRLAENPVDRLRRMICETFWDSLVRRLDGSRLAANFVDSKAVLGNKPRIYVPHSTPEQSAYYKDVSKHLPALQLEVAELPLTFGLTQQSKEMWLNSGILALDMQPQGSSLRGTEYIVPGGRFNEFYYWDSYFAVHGLLEAGKIDLVRGIVENMRFQIDHYGCALNANRSYYLGRSQPPFLSDLVIRTYKYLVGQASPDAEDFLRRGILTAIKEYHQIWMAAPRLCPQTGLSRYRPEGHGIPPEVEHGHFDWFLAGFAKKENMSINQLIDEYNAGRLRNADLDEFFAHDRAVRESGHDTTARFEGQAADLATIDLNSLLYKYETDIAWAIEHQFHDHLVIPVGTIPHQQTEVSHSSSLWTEKAAHRQHLIHRYLWNDTTSSFHDYNTATHLQTPFQTVTAFWALWSGLATPSQAERMVSTTLARFEQIGGLVSTLPLAPAPSPVPSDPIHASSSPDRGLYSHQWDFPFGWAPHQILAWEGLRRYGFEREARRLAYRWLYLLTRIAVDFNGRVTERYTVTKLGRLAEADRSSYGNQGCDFEGVNTEGFAWTNSSYVYGLEVIGEELREFLRQGLTWEEVEERTQKEVAEA